MESGIAKDRLRAQGAVAHLSNGDELRVRIDEPDPRTPDTRRNGIPVHDAAQLVVCQGLHRQIGDRGRRERTQRGDSPFRDPATVTASRTENSTCVGSSQFREVGRATREPAQVARERANVGAAAARDARANAIRRSRRRIVHSCTVMRTGREFERRRRGARRRTRACRRPAWPNSSAAPDRSRR